MPHVAAAGLTFHVQELGAGPAVVMIHGALVDNLALWYFTAAPALARTHRVLLYDLRSHGKSERVRQGFGLGQQARDLEALLGAWHEDEVDLVGHSYGALIALRFALDHPQRVRRLALVEAPLPPSSFEQLQGLMQLESRPDEILAAFPPGLRHALLRGKRRASKLVDSLRFLLTECSLSQDVTGEPDIADDVLAGVRCPTLAVYGKESGCLSTGQRLARVLPCCRLALLDGGHYLPLDAAGPLTAQLEEFLRG